MWDWFSFALFVACQRGSVFVVGYGRNVGIGLISLNLNAVLFCTPIDIESHHLANITELQVVAPVDGVSI